MLDESLIIDAALESGFEVYKDATQVVLSEPLLQFARRVEALCRTLPPAADMPGPAPPANSGAYDSSGPLAA